jgi:CHAT domain-containing protein/Tfp pilus assembly protein PilF
MQLFNQGKLAQAIAKVESALADFERLYPAKTQRSHPDLAVCLDSLGMLLRASGELDRALVCHQRALELFERLYPFLQYPRGHRGTAICLENLAAVYKARGEYSNALAHQEGAVAMKQRLFPRGQYPRGHRDLAAGVSNLGQLLLEMGEHVRARKYHEKALRLFQDLYPPEEYPQGHEDLAVCLNNLGQLLRSRGDHASALPYYERALAMRQKLYPREQWPRGHGQLAISLSNLGSLLRSAGQDRQALPYYRQALEMHRRLCPKEEYPHGTLGLVMALNNLGGLLRSLGEHEAARDCLEQALAMYRRLYPREEVQPRGHYDLASALNNLGLLFVATGEYDRAQEYLEQALASCRRLFSETQFPQGHPRLAHSLSNLGQLLLVRGDAGKARALLGPALEMRQRLGDRLAASASEAEALAFLASLPFDRDAFLSAALQARTSAPDLYGRVWRSRAALTRALQRRHQATRVALAASDSVRRTWQELLDLRRQLSLQLSEPVRDLPARDKELRRLTDRKEALERALAAVLPEIDRNTELDQLGPPDLAARLPAHSAFIDLVRYRHFGKGGQPADKYLAFVVKPGKPAEAVPLTLAGPIDEAVRAWRQAIAKGADTPADAARVARLVWEPLAQELPRGTTTVYLAPDGELARLPWAALPGKKPGTVLLEELAVAVVPHGPFLLEQLKYPPHYPAGAETVLALGGVDYGPARKGVYDPLDGTRVELKQILALAGKRQAISLQGDQVTWQRLKAELPKVRYAHLATHGFFDDQALHEEQKRIEQQRRDWQFQISAPTERLGSGARSPLGFTGLALAGANAGPEGIATGEALVELPLENLRLCVLSACQSGLGDLGPVSGESAQGLPRALHLAGCPNVIASLWNVSDQATAALMAKFYHELWTNGKPPLEALRLAQLTILRHPERISALAAVRSPNFHDTVKLPPDVAAGRPVPARSATRLWAAFVLSGAGR